MADASSTTELTSRPEAPHMSCPHCGVSVVRFERHLTRCPKNPKVRSQLRKCPLCGRKTNPNKQSKPSPSNRGCKLCREVLRACAVVNSMKD